ncbi:MAG TPA: GGDEF domain-containing protein [Gemmatimonadaceae bacterium]|nr:GGDEF domain-containing protein [Gemmatimonadaceae bacterium]
MTHPPGWRRAAVPAAWLVALVSLIALRGLQTDAVWLQWAAAVVALAAYALAGRALVAGVPAAFRHDLTHLLALAAAPLLILVAASGGSASPASVAAGPIVLGIAWRSGFTRGAATAAAAVVLLGLADVVVHGVADVPGLLAVGAAIGAVGLGPLWHGRRVAVAGLQAKRRLARVEGYMAERRMTPHGSRAIASDLRRDAQDVQQHAEGLAYLGDLDRFLRDVRDGLGGDEAILWKWNESRGTQVPLAWSTENADAPAHFQYEEWAPLVKWSAESGKVHCLTREGLVRFVAASVERNGRLYGALSLSAAEGLGLPGEQARDWLGRHAAHAALLGELFEMRREYGKLSRYQAALNHATQKIRPSAAPAELKRAICDTALEITSGQRAALIRWQPREDAGLVEATSKGHPVREQFTISGDALVAAQCRVGTPMLKGDAKQVARRHAVYGSGEAKRDIGCIAIAPLTRDSEVFGALVVEADAAEGISVGELKNLNLLGIIAVTALQVSWEIQEVSRRARTDPLTGLGNRRHFDEELARLLEGSDRFGNSTALIVADIDHFKAINDRLGHDAGDAVLKHVAQVLTEGVRAIDLCARYGGEEIVVLLPQTTVAGAAEVAERLRRAVESRPTTFRGQSIPVTCSFGVSAFPQCAARRDGLFGAADRALYAAKSAGRNRVKSASEIHVLRHVEREQELR